MAVEVRHLRAFLAIAEEGTLTRAAVRLHLSQPALSRTLAQLEQHLGARLVDRSTHHLELTDLGQSLRAKAFLAVAAVDEALDPALLGTWPLRVGHAWSALGARTTALLRRWRQAYPETPLELLRIDDRSAGLSQGRVDVAVLRSPIADAGVTLEPLVAEPRLAAVPADSPLAGRPSILLADLVPYPLAVNPVSGSTSLDLWPRAAAPKTTVAVANTDDWLSAIAAARAVGVTTTATAEMYPTPAVAYVPLTDAPDVIVQVAWRDPPSHPRVAAFVALAHAVVIAR
ncbi:MAG TPA: LysR family transcriptional regulator [Actinoplanes sp.]|nr:LysR family transcriptional regulator [Actinoplanes sp.]